MQSRKVSRKRATKGMYVAFELDLKMHAGFQVDN